jgi:hypothetical protein
LEISVSDCSDRLCLTGCRPEATIRVTTANFAKLRSGSCFDWWYQGVNGTGDWEIDWGSEHNYFAKLIGEVDIGTFSCDSMSGSGLLDGAQATTPFALVGFALLAIFY